VPTTAINFTCSSCKTENSVEVQTGGRGANALQLKCGFCNDAQPPEKLDSNAPKEGKAVHQWVRGEEGWEQVF
jgi:hypothetical protein